MNSTGYGGSAAQRGYEAPACVQNAMVTKDKKPFTYTPGGIDLTQIKSERMAKRLARNAQAEGATGASQHNRPAQPQSPGGGNAASQIGAAGMGMPFQVLPPPPPPGPIAGKKSNGASAPPPPPPPSSSSTLAPPQNGARSGSPNAQRKSPTPQRFEPPPMGFRPEIKIPPNPMSALRKVPPPVEKNTFWKDEYVRDRSKSPMVGENDRASSPNTAAAGASASDSAAAANAGNGEPAQVTLNNNNNSNIANNNADNEQVDGYRKPTTTTTQPELYQKSNNSTQSQQYTPPTQQPLQQQQQQQQQSQPQYNNTSPPGTASTPPQQQQSPRSELHSVAPAEKITRQTDSPRSDTSTPPQRATESPFRYGGVQQQQPAQQRAPPAISPLVQQPQQQSPKSYSSPPPPTAAAAATAAGVQSVAANNSPNSQPSAQAVPWRTQRTPTQQQQPQSTTIYNNVSPQQQQPQQQQQNSAYQGSKPTNVGSLYIAPLAAPTEPQAPSVVRQFQQQQQPHQRESPVRQLPQQQQQQSPPQQQQQSQALRSNVPWLSSKPKANEQPEWARPEENGNVVPSSLNRMKSPPPPQQSQQQQQLYYQPQQQHQQPPQLYGYQPEPVNAFTTATPANFGSHGVGGSGLRLQINANANIAPTQQTGPRERIIPIQLEQTPTTAPQQPNFNVSYGGITTAPRSYTVRSPNQFVDQGYNNYPNSAGIQQPSAAAVNAQRVMSPTQQLNAPRIVQQQQQYANNNSGAAGGNRSRVIPIAMDSGVEGTRGPISPSPIVLQNDPRSSPIQSKSFRILQKITDTIGDANGDDKKAEIIADVEPQLQRPQYARQMSAQQARPQTNVEQMRRMHITPDAQQQQYQSQSLQGWNQDMPQPYVHPSEQQVPEPKKYTGSAIPSRSFKILQAMTTPENAADLAATDYVESNENPLNANEGQSKKIDNTHFTTNFNENYEDSNESSNTSKTQLPSTSSLSSISSLSSDSCTHTIPKHPYPAYGYPYPYHWYPPPHMPNTNGEAYPIWPYAYPPPPTPSTASTNEQNNNATHPSYPPFYPYYYPYYPPPPPHTANYIHPTQVQNQNEFDTQNAYHDFNATAYPAYVPPYPYPYPVAPSYSRSTSSSRASSVLPDIIVTPSTDDMPSQVILQHHIKVEKREAPKSNDAVGIEEVASNSNAMRCELLKQRLEEMSKVVENNLNMSQDVLKNYAGERDKEFGERSPTDNASPVPVPIVTLASETELSTDADSNSDDDSDMTPKCVETKGLQAIKSVTNIQVYKHGNCHIVEADDDDDDVTTADGESDIFDEEDNEEDAVEELELDECIEENDDMDYDNLSVIYEEESEVEHSSEKPNTIIQRAGSCGSDATTVEKVDDIEKQIEENDLNDDDTEEDSTSVTVRLPLKFSFDNENVATVEVGKSQIEEKRHSFSCDEKLGAFVIAKLAHDSDDEDDGENDDCEVSVTVSLSGSSRSASLERTTDRRGYTNAYSMEPSSGIVEDDISPAFSLNMRNKFMDQTINDDVTNNIAKIQNKTTTNTQMEEIKETDTSSTATATVTQVVASDDLDFFATLRATKLQAQKMMEQSASYWGKLKEKQEPQNEQKDKEICGTTKVEEETEVEDIWADRNDDMPKPVPKLTLTNAKDDFWSTFAAATKKTHEEIFETQTEEIVAVNDAKAQPEHVAAHAEAVKEDEEIDFWAEIEKSKENNSTVSETKAKSTPWTREIINEVIYKPRIMKSHTKVLPMPTQAELCTPLVEHQSDEESSESEEEESEQDQVAAEKIICADMKTEAISEEDQEEEEEEDFWASVEKAKTTLTTTGKPNLSSTIEDTPLTHVVEEEIDFWANIDKRKNETKVEKQSTYDPTLYPAEPREVDTDEEIDFWAEIEAKNENTDDVSFYKSASFWASQERKNSIDETPYTKVARKPFAAILPDEPTVDVGLWAALEAAKGAEPDYIDPEVEEEKALATQFDEMPQDYEAEAEAEAEVENNDDIEKNSDVSWSVASLHEPVVANIWEPTVEMNEYSKPYHDLEQWIHNEDDDRNINAVLEETAKPNITNDVNEANIKRNNYRKAMAFFSTSIDEQKEASAEPQIRRGGRYSNRNSLIETNKAKINIEENTSNVRAKSVGAESIYQEAGAQAVAQSTTNGRSFGTELLYNESLLQSIECAEVNTERNTTPTNFEQTLPEVYVEPILEKKLLPNGLPDLGLKKEEPPISVRDRISAFETGAVETPTKPKKNDIYSHSLSVTPNGTLSRNSSQRSESEMEEDDSGVTDMNKPLSETDTESESFPELRKMSSYQRATTHSRLFKLLQDDNDTLDEEKLSKELADEFHNKPSRRKIVHNVSITRRQNANVLTEAETLSQRRERLSLPLRKNTSIDADNPSTPNSPASPIMGQPSNSRGVSDKLVNELVQSLLLKRDSSHLRQLPMEKLQAAAKRVLEEELDSLENTSVETTPAPTPNAMKTDNSYADYYDTWSLANGNADGMPPKPNRVLQDVQRRSPWSVRCPRVLSSKTINRDLSRVTESPEIFTRSSKSPDCLSQSREGSVSRRRKV